MHRTAGCSVIKAKREKEDSRKEAWRGRSWTVDGFILYDDTSDIEARLDDSDLTPERLKEENDYYREGFWAYDEDVTLIDEDYEASIESLLD